jgi:AraC-like DNA-binding protein
LQLPPYRLISESPVICFIDNKIIEYGMDKSTTITYDILAESTVLVEFAGIVHELTGMAVALYPVDGNWQKSVLLTGSCDESPLCNIIRKHSKGMDACKKCGQHWIKQAADTLQPVRYKCHAGLYDFALPIIHDKKAISVISTGQLLSSPPSEDGLAEFLQHNIDLKLSIDDTRIAYFQAPYMDEEKVKAALKMMTFFAEHLYNSTKQILELTAIQGYDRVMLAKHYIEQHICEAINQDDVANAACCTPAYLSRLFRKQTGCTFIEYMQQMRLQNVKQKLISSNRNITEIALSCGFSSLSQFNRTFKKLEGCTPVEYRNKNKISI